MKSGIHIHRFLKVPFVALVLLSACHDDKVEQPCTLKTSAGEDIGSSESGTRVVLHAEPAPAGAQGQWDVVTGAGGIFSDASQADATFTGQLNTTYILDAQGNVYVADKGGHSIRKISPQGMVTTLAGK